MHNQKPSHNADPRTFATYAKFVKTWLSTLLSPSPTITNFTERQRAQTLIHLILILIAVAIPTFYTSSLLGTAAIMAQSVSIVALFVTFVLAKTRYVRLAAYLLCTIPSLTINLALITKSINIIDSRGGPSLYNYGLAIILAGLVLQKKDLERFTIISHLILLISIFGVQQYPITPEALYALADETTFIGILTLIVHSATALRSQYENELQIALKHAEQANQSKTDFLAKTSHELRTPLHSIINMVNLVLKYAELQDRERHLLELAQNSGTLLQYIINNILDLTSSTNSPLKISSSDNVDILEIIHTAHKIVVTQTGKNGHNIEYRLPNNANLPTLHADKQRLTQVFINLLANSSKFTYRGFIEVTINHLLEINKLSIQIKDTGIGIAPDRLENIFVPYHQENTDKTRKTGTGLGIPISKIILQAHGGTITVQSQENVGTTFTIELPTTELPQLQ